MSVGTAGLLLLSFGAQLFVSGQAQDSLTLPQTRHSVRLTDAVITATRSWLGGSATGTAEMPAALQTAVMQSLPASFEDACSRLLNAWAGDRGRNSSAWRVGVVDRGDTFLWLTLTCASGLGDPDMARYRDERLARLRLADGQLEIPVLSVDDDSRDAVRRVESAGHVVLPNATGFAFRVYFDDNPCCDGPESRTQVRTVVFVDAPSGLREALSIVTGRDNASHSDEPDVDVETKYQADLTFDRNANGVVTGAHATFRDRVVETTWKSGKANPRTTRDRTGRLQFRWNPVTFVFEPIK